MEGLSLRHIDSVSIVEIVITLMVRLLTDAPTPFPVEGIQIRGLNEGMPVTSHRWIALVVGQNIQDVGPGCSRWSYRSRDGNIPDIAGGHYGIGRIACINAPLIVPSRKRVRAERDRFVGFVEDAVERIPEEQKLRGHARFLDDNTLDVDGTRVEAKSVVIATGTYPWTPPVLDAVSDLVITNEGFFEQDALTEGRAYLYIR